MKSSLSAFKKGLSDLQLYMEGLALETKIIPIDKTGELADWELHYKLLCDHYQATRSIKKRHDYNSIIISMYGLVEQYIEALMQNYLELLQKIVPSYHDIPVSIINNHIGVSFELIKQTDQSRYRGANTKEKIISRLNSCLTEPQNYKLNSEAFCQHVANFRSDVIDLLFNKVGLSNIMQRTMKNQKFNQLLKDLELDDLHYSTEKGSGQKMKEDKEISLNERAFYSLNDLADRRNEVAHGVSSELLGHGILLGYIQFLKTFGETIYDVLLQNLLQKEIRFYGHELGKPTDIYKDGHVLCVWSKNAHIKKNDYIAGHNTNEFVVGRILEIQESEIEVSEISKEKSVEIGIRTNGTFKKSHNVFFLERNKEILL